VAKPIQGSDQADHPEEGDHAEEGDNAKEIEENIYSTKNIIIFKLPLF